MECRGGEKEIDLSLCEMCKKHPSKPDSNLCEICSKDYYAAMWGCTEEEFSARFKRIAQEGMDGRDN